jgi:hypothetical protein
MIAFSERLFAAALPGCRYGENEFFEEKVEISANIV